MTDLTARLPGRADTVLDESSFRDDHPEIWAAYKASRSIRRAGRGYTATVTLPAEWWEPVKQYFISKAGALSAAIADVGDPSDVAELRAVFTAVDRIRIAR